MMIRTPRLRRPRGAPRRIVDDHDYTSTGSSSGMARRSGKRSPSTSMSPSDPPSVRSPPMPGSAAADPPHAGRISPILAAAARQRPHLRPSRGVAARHDRRRAAAEGARAESGPRGWSRNPKSGSPRKAPNNRHCSRAATCHRPRSGRADPEASRGARPAPGRRRAAPQRRADATRRALTLAQVSPRSRDPNPGRGSPRPPGDPGKPRSAAR